MAITFPTSPSLNDTHTAGDIIWTWNGSSWESTVVGTGMDNVVEDTTPQLGGDLDTNSNKITFADSVNAEFGNDGDLKIFHNGGHSIVRETGTGDLYLQSDNNVILSTDSSTKKMVKGIANGATELYHNDVLKLNTSTSGVTIVDEVHTEGATPHLTLKRTDNANVPTVRFKGSGGTVGASIEFDGTSGTANELAFQTYDGSSLAERFRVTYTGAKVSGDLDLEDDNKIKLGTGDDLQIWHNASNSIIQNATGQLQLRGNTIRLLNAATTKDLAFFNDGGSVDLYHDNSKKFETTTTGATVTGTLVADGVTLGDNEQITLGASSDLVLLHNGTNSVVKDAGTGSLSLQSNGTEVNVWDGANGQYMAEFNTGGTVNLYHNGTEKFKTTSGGVTVTGDLTTTADIELGHASDTTIARSSAGVVTIEGNTIITTGNSDTPTTTTSSSDADFVLVDDGGTMKKITPSNLGITSGGASKGFAVAMAIAL